MSDQNTLKTTAEFPARQQAKDALANADNNWLVWAQLLAPALTVVDYETHLRIAAALLLAHEGHEP